VGGLDLFGFPVRNHFARINSGLLIGAIAPNATGVTAMRYFFGHQCVSRLPQEPMRALDAAG